MTRELLPLLLVALVAIIALVLVMMAAKTTPVGSAGFFAETNELEPDGWDTITLPNCPQSCVWANECQKCLCPGEVCMWTIEE